MSILIVAKHGLLTSTFIGGGAENCLAVVVPPAAVNAVAHGDEPVAALPAGVFVLELLPPPHAASTSAPAAAITPMISVRFIPVLFTPPEIWPQHDSKDTIDAPKRPPHDGSIFMRAGG
jgi:hypothetical protein